MSVQISNSKDYVCCGKQLDFLILSFSWHTYTGLKLAGSTRNRRHFPHKGSRNHHYMAAQTKPTERKAHPRTSVLKNTAPAGL